jgi:hypothetical protein
MLPYTRKTSSWRTCKDTKSHKIHMSWSAVGDECDSFARLLTVVLVCWFCSLVIHDPVPRTLQAARVGESVYNVTFSINHVGTHMFQVFVGKRQAPDSPFMVEVTSKACPGGKVANVVGDCVCTNKFINTVRSCAYFGSPFA